MNNFVYTLAGKAYINLTNRCHNRCAFCIRNSGDGVAGTPLWLEREPTAQEVIVDFEKIKGGLVSREVVFCGYGEPTEALDALKECAAYFKARGYSTRLNTNGLGSAVNGRDITGELGDFDTVSVSLNEYGAEKYDEICRPTVKDAFSQVLAFATGCKNKGGNVVFTVVDTIGAGDVEKCKELCRELCIPLRVREYVADNYQSESN